METETVLNFEHFVPEDSSLGAACAPKATLLSKFDYSWYIQMKSDYSIDIHCQNKENASQKEMQLTPRSGSYGWFKHGNNIRPRTVMEDPGICKATSVRLCKAAFEPWSEITVPF